jgi:hypothetical protein
MVREVLAVWLAIAADTGAALIVTQWASVTLINRGISLFRP